MGMWQYAQASEPEKHTKECQFSQKFSANFDMPKNVTVNENATLPVLLGNPVTKTYNINCDNAFVPVDKTGFLVLKWHPDIINAGRQTSDGIIVPSNLPGIGILITIRRQDGSVVPLNTYGGGILPLRNPIFNNQKSQDHAISITAQFIQTAAPIQEIRMIKARPLFQFNWVAMHYGVPVSQGDIATTGSTFVDAPACSLDPGSKHTTVTLPDANRGLFKGKTTVVATGQPFHIKLNCYVKSSIKISFSSHQKSIKYAGVIHSASGSGFATGIGVQILSIKTGNPVTFDQPFILDTSEDGRSTRLLQFYARYFQTESRVTPGKVQAEGTYLLEYQ